MKSHFFEGLGIGICAVVAILSLLWELAIVNALFGGMGVAIAIALFPGTLVLVPWYMLFVYGNYRLLMFTYGGLFFGVGITRIGSKDVGDSPASLVHAGSVSEYDKTASDAATG
jgi:hypothetical protein